MNRTLKLAFSALAGTVIAMPAFAQGDQFPDVAENHWVFEALLNMKNEGILVGYPDSLFRGGRPASRYELAGAINAAYMKLKGMIGGMGDQIDSVKAMIDEINRRIGAAGSPDLEALKRELAQLKTDMEAMKRWGDNIAALQRMADTFRADLAKWGVDVEAMKKDLADLADRVGVLEKHKPAVDIHGDLNVVSHMGHSTDGLFGITVDRRPTGFGRGSYFGEPVGMTRDWTVGHEGAFTFTGTNEEGPKWHATLVVGNLLGFDSFEGGGAFYGNQSSLMTEIPFGEQTTRVYFQTFGVNFDTSVWGQGFTAELGRVGYQAGSMFFERRDNTPYFYNARWDNGDWYFDGGILNFGWGGVTLDVYGGRNSARLDSSGGIFGFGNEIWPMSAGPQDPSFSGFGDLMIDQSLGFHLDIGLGGNGKLGLNYIFLDSNTLGSFGGSDYNRVVVWGGELNWDLNDNFSVGGGYSQSDLYENSSKVLSDDNAAWWAHVGFSTGNVNVMAGYRRIEPYFGAPGDWGRTGFLWNPVDHQGFYGNVNVELGSRTNLNVGGFFFEGIDGMILPADAEWTGVNAKLTFAINNSWDLMLGGEWVRYDMTGGYEPTVTWWRAGLKYNMGEGQMLKFMYEISDFDADLSPGIGMFPSSDRKGGLLTAQWSKKF